MAKLGRSARSYHLGTAWATGRIKVPVGRLTPPDNGRESLISLGLLASLLMPWLMSLDTMPIDVEGGPRWQLNDSTVLGCSKPLLFLRPRLCQLFL